MLFQLCVFPACMFHMYSPLVRRRLYSRRVQAFVWRDGLFDELGSGRKPFHEEPPDLEPISADPSVCDVRLMTLSLTIAHRYDEERILRGFSEIALSADKPPAPPLHSVEFQRSPCQQPHRRRCHPINSLCSKSSACASSTERGFRWSTCATRAAGASCACPTRASVSSAARSGTARR